MKRTLTTLILSKAIALSPFFLAADAGAQSRTTIEIYNDSSENAELYVDDGSGRWRYKATIRAGAHGDYTAFSGDEWGFADPNSRRTDIVRSVRVGRFGARLILTDRDIGGGPPPLIGREITVTNNSSDTVDVYSNHGHGWHREGTLRPRQQARYPAKPGEVWGIGDPHGRPLDMVKQTTIKPIDMTPFLTVSDRDLGHAPPPRPATRNVTVYNDSSQSVGIYSAMAGPGGARYKLEGTVSPGRQRTFTGNVGEDWGADDPGRFGVNIVKRITVRSGGSNNLSIRDSDIGGRPGPGPGPGPAPAQVTIRFKNQSYSNVSISRKTGPFSKVNLSSVGGGDSNSLRLTPGEVIVLHMPGKPVLPIHYTVPNRSETYSFRFNY